MTVAPEPESMRAGTVARNGIMPGPVCMEPLVNGRAVATPHQSRRPVAPALRAPQTAAGELLSGRDAALWPVAERAIDPARWH
jgi:hypothetical protein